MYRYVKANISLLSFIFIPILFLWNPSWVSFLGVQPYWPLFWLLPWAIIVGPIKGALTALITGIILDSLNNDLYTQIPGLIICGLWFGTINKFQTDVFLHWRYGLFAALGSFICGVIYFLQILFSHFPQKYIL